MVERAVGVDAWHRRLNGVVGLEALRRRDALEDSGRRARSVAAHGQDARAPVRELDLEDGRSVGPRPLVNVVDETDLALEIGELPADERRDRISAAPAARGRPGAASGSAGRASAVRGRDKISGPCERDRVTVGRRCRRVTPRVDRRRRYPGGADDVPANVLSAVGRPRRQGRDERQCNEK